MNHVKVRWLRKKTIQHLMVVNDLNKLNLYNDSNELIFSFFWLIHHFMSHFAHLIDTSHFFIPLSSVSLETFFYDSFLAVH
jgi:hypothetical protein